MRYFRLSAKETPWADYSDILFYGMTAALPRKDGLIQYQRTGPWQPDFIQSAFSLLAVESMKALLEHQDLPGVSFRPVLMQHIVDFNWSAWDMDNEEPAIYPNSGRPEDYVLDKPHNPAVLARMESVWEMTIPVSGFVGGDDSLGDFDSQFAIFQPRNNGFVVVSDEFKTWIEHHTDRWFEFEEQAIRLAG